MTKNEACCESYRRSAYNGLDRRNRGREHLLCLPKRNPYVR